MCGATTVGTGLNTNVFVNGMLAAVVGDLDSHNMLGALISQSPGTIKINGIPMIASIMDQGSPDVIGTVTHVTGLPTPGTGSPNVNLYNGNFAGGLGNFSLAGLPGIGELMSFGGNIIGQVYRTANQGSNSGMLALNNLNLSYPQPTSGSTITSANTGKTFTFTSYYYDGAVAGGSSLNISPAAGALTTGTQGSSYSQTFTASNGFTPYTYAVVGSLPSGLSLNTSTGAMTGTPSVYGTYSFSIKVTDNIGSTFTNTYTLTLNPIPLALSPAPGTLTSGKQGTSYSQAFTASYGVTPYTYAVVGSLPSGLSLNASTGVVSGTPTTLGSYSFSIRVTDAASSVVTNAYSLTIASAYYIITTGLNSYGNMRPPGGADPNNGYYFNGTATVSMGTFPPSWNGNAAWAPLNSRSKDSQTSHCYNYPTPSYDVCIADWGGVLAGVQNNNAYNYLDKVEFYNSSGSLVQTINKASFVTYYSSNIGQTCVRLPGVSSSLYDADYYPLTGTTIKWYFSQ